MSLSLRMTRVGYSGTSNVFLVSWHCAIICGDNTVLRSFQGTLLDSTETLAVCMRVCMCMFLRFVGPCRVTAVP